MPALPVIADVFRCALKWTDASAQDAVNVIHIQTNAAGRTPTQVFTLIDANVTANMWASVGNSGAVQEVDITPLDGVTATQSFNTGAPAKWTGPGGGQQIPQSACLVKLSTGLRGRSRRGRIFLPFMSEAAIANGIIGGATVAAAQTAWDAFVAALVADATTPSTLSVASYKTASAVSVDNVLIEQVAATQRRRQGRLR